MTPGYKFIIIDDDPYNNIICRELIRMTIHAPCQVVDFLNPEEGLAYVSNEHHLPSDMRTLLFLDINMPTMSGWEFLEQFDKLDEKIKRRYEIYILSSSINPRDREQARLCNHVKDYMIKPVPEDFLAALDSQSSYQEARTAS
jgi:response regulator RpfG family c-di-GMP phosphodiesterase